MSSMPFCLGVPVVDKLMPRDGTVVLRAKNQEHARREIGRLLSILTTKDVVKVHPIGLRPDHPIPVAMYFEEVRVEIGKAEEWQRSIQIGSLYSWVSTGKREAT